MEMKKVVKTLVLILMLSPISAACSPVGKETTGSSAPPEAKTPETMAAVSTKEPDDPVFNELGVLPLFKQPVTLTVGIPSTVSDDLDNNYYTRLLEEKSNADLEFQLIGGTGADFRQKLSLMIASNSELPDIILGGLEMRQSNQYGSMGVFLSLNNYYENSSFYIRHYMDLGDRETLLPYATAPNGNIYGIFKDTREMADDFMYRAWINKTWLNALGLEMPVTTEDFYNVLTAFKTQDPNGNGQADELPLVGSTAWNRQPFEFLMNAFTYTSAGGANNVPYLQIKDGRLAASYVLPEWKAGLEYQNRLVTDGLISGLTYTQGDAELKQILENEDVQLVGVIPTNSMSVYLADSVRKEDFVPLPPLTGPEGVNFVTRVTFLPINSFFITKYCNNPEAAFRLGDLMWEEELSITSRFGEEGVHWQYYSGDKKSLYDYMGIPARLEILQNIWGQEEAKKVHWGDFQPAKRTYEMGVMAQVFDGNIYDSQYMTAVSVPCYADKTPEDAVLYISFTDEEWNTISDIANSIRTYVDESKTRFIVGDLGFSEWDNYVNELNKMGLEDYLTICRQAYDRMESLK